MITEGNGDRFWISGSSWTRPTEVWEDGVWRWQDEQVSWSNLTSLVSQSIDGLCCRSQGYLTTTGWLGEVNSRKLISSTWFSPHDMVTGVVRCETSQRAEPSREVALKGLDSGMKSTQVVWLGWNPWSCRLLLNPLKQCVLRQVSLRQGKIQLLQGKRNNYYTECGSPKPCH